jgi:hypothetical protein
MAEKAEAVTEDGNLKSGYSFRNNWVGRDDREVIQLVKTVAAETRYGGMFHSRVRQIVVGQTFV